jgi:DNA topoisomerase-1
MKQELIITEKPATAKKIAEALADGKPSKKNNQGIPYYELKHKNKDITVGCAVGHVFSLAEKEKKGWTYPVYDIEWKPAYEVGKKAEYTKKYIDTLKKLSKTADSFVIASVDYNEITPVIENDEFKIVKIGEFVDNAIKTNKDVKKCKVPSFDFKSKKISFKPLKKVIRHKIHEELYKIDLSYSRSVKITSSHSVFTFSNNKIKQIKASKLKEGDILLCPNKVPSFNKLSKINLLDILYKSKISREIFVEGKDIAKILSERIKMKLRKKHYLNDKRIILTNHGRIFLINKRISLKIPQNKPPKKINIAQSTISLWENEKKNPTIKNLKEYLKYLKINFKTFKNNKKYVKEITDSSFQSLLDINYTKQFKEYSNLKRATIQLSNLSPTEIKKIKDAHIYGSKNKRGKIKIQLDLDSDFFRLIGYYLAEGDINSDYRIRFSLGNIESGHENFIRSDIKKIVDSKFKINATSIFDKRQKTEGIIIDNTVLAQLFKNMLGFRKNEATSKRIPSIVFNTNNNNKLEFLKGYFLGDGSLKNGCITFNTSSKLLAQELQYLLLQLNIIAGNTKSICKTSKSRNPMHRINITNSTDLKKLKKIYEYHWNSKELKLGKPKKIRININDLSLLKIKKIKRIKPSRKYVYDFSVEGENFIAGTGGVCCHNTDYDIEGEVIGLNVIRYVCKQKDAKRMKFSTLTKDELIDSYEHAQKTINWGQALAGETRHELDWYYGINTSRALTLAVKAATGQYKILSTGRVQGPALKIIVDKEKEITAFISQKYWQIQLIAEAKNGVIEAWHKEDKFWEKEKADKVMEKVKDEKKGKIKDKQTTEFKQQPPFPFDLTSMQIEAYKVMKIKPKETLEIAQDLYTGGYISYPRTSSQKLPPSLGYAKILNKLMKQEKYKKLCSQLLETKNLKPNEGQKIDEAHPAIHPTGETPKALRDRTAKIYDLIVKRFMATFSEPAIRETSTITIDVKEEEFISKGTRTKEKGWHIYYEPYVKLEEEELPKVEIGEEVKIKDINQQEKETQPPRRYTPASLIKELEKRNLGTKATRSVIIENLYSRGYIKEENIQATELGIKTVQILEKYIPEIVDEQLTRHFEEEMEKIRTKEMTEEQILEEAREVLNKIFDKFNKKKKEVGKELSEANTTMIRAETTIGKCPNCEEGQLILKKGKYGRFIGCNKYPECKTIFKVPPKGMLKPTNEICVECNHPMVEIREFRQGPRLVCINPNCPTWKPGYKKENK